MVNSICLMSGLGLSAGICLALAWKLFRVEENPELEKIKETLPGANCGACGYIGCADAAGAILEGRAPVNICAAGGFEVVSRLSAVLNITPPFSGPAWAVAGCTGGVRSEERFFYRGVGKCQAEHLLFGGSKVCEKGCLGHGSCIDACLFDAISLGPGLIPKINESRCRGCGKCVEVCPTGVLSLTGLSQSLLHLNREDECLAPCLQKCPAQVNIPKIIRQIRAKNFAGALMTIRERNPLPLSVGRVCAHPCENICRRNIADSGVSICQLERFLSEAPLRCGHHEPLTCLPDTGHAIAVIGGGPAGLSCAYFLRRLGHRPVIFEKQDRLGGMLRYGIPEYRLPKKLVDTDIQGIIQLGITARTGTAFGRDFSFAQLKERGFEAVFLGMGAWHIPALCVDGEYLDHVIKSLEFLSRVGKDITDLSGTSVAVIGESNTAMDCARSCIRLNAASVTVICPVLQDRMSARKRDVTRAMDEGVSIRFLTVPTRILSEDGQNASAMAYCCVTPTEKKKIEGTEKIMDTGLIISAYERKPDIDFLLNGGAAPFRFTSSAKATLAADPSTLLASEPYIFTAGDMYTGRASVIEAVAGGRRAARSIHFYLTTGEIPLAHNIQKRINPKSIKKNVVVSGHSPKVEVEERDIESRKTSFVEEVLGTISRNQALSEADRCLRCGTHCND